MSKNTKIDFDSLTLGEVATIENLSGFGIGALNEEKPQGKFLAALYMVVKRRSGEPTYTFNQAMNVPIKEANEYLGFGEDDDADDAEADETAPADDATDTQTGGLRSDLRRAEGNAGNFGLPVTD